MKPALLMLSSFWIFNDTAILLLLLSVISIKVICSDNFTNNFCTLQVFPVSSTLIFISNILSIACLYLLVITLSVIAPFVYSTINFGLGQFTYPTLLSVESNLSSPIIIPLSLSLFCFFLIFLISSLALGSVFQTVMFVSKNSLSIYILTVSMIVLASLGSSLESPKFIQLLYAQTKLSDLSPLLISAKPLLVFIRFTLIALLCFMFSLLFNQLRIKISGACYGRSN